MPIVDQALLVRVQEAAKKYRDGGEPYETICGETGQTYTAYTYPPDKVGKKRVDEFLRFLEDIISEPDADIKTIKFMALMEVLLRSSSEVLEKKICMAILPDERNPHTEAKKWVYSFHPQESRLEELLCSKFSEYNAKIKPSAFTRISDKLGSMFCKKQSERKGVARSALPEPTSLNAHF